MKKIISILILLALVVSAVPNYSAQELPERSFFVDERGNPQSLIVLTEAASAKDIQRVSEIVTRITNEAYYQITGTDERIVWQSPTLIEDDNDNVALGYTGIKSNLEWAWNFRSFTTPAYFISHGADPTPAWPNCPFYVESLDALFDGDRNTRIVGRTGYDFFGPGYEPITLLVKFNDFKEITDVNFTFANFPVFAGYQIYYLSSQCPQTLYNPDFWMFGPTGNWQLLPVAGGWPRAGSATKVTDSFSLTNPVETNALFIEINPWWDAPPNPALPYSLYSLEVKGSSFSVLYADRYHVDFTWGDKTLDQRQNLLRNLDFWIEDIEKVTLPGDFIETQGKSYASETARYNILNQRVDLLRMYQDDQTGVGRLFYGTPLTWENEEFRVGQTKTYGNYKVTLVDINWDKSQTTLNFDHTRGRGYIGEQKATIEVTDPEGVVRRHIVTIDCCDKVLTELFVDTQADSESAKEALCELTRMEKCDIAPIVFHSRMDESAIDPFYLPQASQHFGDGAHAPPFPPFIYGYGYNFNASGNYPTLIFNGDRDRAIQMSGSPEEYYQAFSAAYDLNASRCCDAKIVINTIMDPERFRTQRDREALVTVRLNRDLPETELYLNVWGINRDGCLNIATNLINSQYWQNINKWTTECAEEILDDNWKELKKGDVYRTEIHLCGTDYDGIVAFLQDRNTGRVYGSSIRYFSPSPGSNLWAGASSSSCQCVIEYTKDLDCDNRPEEVEFAIEGADIAFIGMEHDLPKNIDGNIKNHMIARFNIYTLIDYGCIDEDCNYIENDGATWRLRFLMNDPNAYNPYVDRCQECTRELRSIKIELVDPIPFDCLERGSVFWGPDRFFRVYVEEYDESSHHIEYRIQRVDLIPKKEEINVKVEPTNLIRTDKQITPQDRANYNLILIGNKDNHQEIKRLHDMGVFVEKEGMTYLKNVYYHKDILILNAKKVENLDSVIIQLSYLLDMIL